MTTTHHLPAEDAMAFFDGEQTDPGGRTAAHVQSCATCQALAQDLNSVSALVSEWTVEPTPDHLVAPPGHARRIPLSRASKLILVAAACALLYIALPFLPATPGSVRQIEDPAVFSTHWTRQPRVDLGLQIGGARVIVVAFMDWLCHPCKKYSLAYDPVLSRYERDRPGQVKLIVRDWPWNQACNPRVPKTMRGHEGSCMAALAVRIARDRGKAEAMIAWLFENIERLILMSEEEVSAAIKQELQRLLGRLDFDAAAAAVRPAFNQDLAEGATLAINATPTFFINGVRIPMDGQLTPEYFDRAIALELKSATR